METGVNGRVFSLVTKLRADVTGKDILIWHAYLIWWLEILGNVLVLQLLVVLGETIPSAYENLYLTI